MLYNGVILDITSKKTATINFYYINPIAFKTPYFKGYIEGLTACQVAIKDKYDEFAKKYKIAGENATLFFVVLKNTLITLKKEKIESFNKRWLFWLPYTTYGTVCAINKALRIVKHNYKAFMRGKGIYDNGI